MRVYSLLGESSSSLRFRDRRTRMRYGTFLQNNTVSEQHPDRSAEAVGTGLTHRTPLAHTALLRRVSMRTSGVPISFTANLRISFSARGALLLKELSEEDGSYRVNSTNNEDYPVIYSPSVYMTIIFQTNPFGVIFSRSTVLTQIQDCFFHGNTSEKTCSSYIQGLDQGWATSVLEGHCPAEFSSNPNQTHLPVVF